MSVPMSESWWQHLSSCCETSGATPPPTPQGWCRDGHRQPLLRVVRDGDREAPPEVEAPAGPAVGPAGHPSIAALGLVTRRRAALDAEMIERTADVVVAARDRVLDQRGLVGVQLGKGHARSVAAQVRDLAAAEIEVLTGFGVRVHDDGMATLTVTGPAVSLCAVHQRIDRIARSQRHDGDERTLDELRADAIAALLLHGTLELPDPDEIDELTPERLAELVATLHAQPRVQLQVVVPHDVLGVGVPICGSCAAALRADGAGQPVLPLDDSPPGVPPPPADLRPSPPGRGQVAEVLGPTPFFITPGHARELALLPGTTLFRLLTDPPDGRLIQRTIGAYRPDAEMIRQVRAADVYSRAPGSRLSGQSCELDHVIPFGRPGSITAGTNLGTLDKRRHEFTTTKAWQVAINDRRDLTFATLLGQITQTRVHDYRQDLHARTVEDLEDRLHLADAAVYAALAAQPEHRYRPVRDAWLMLTHTDEDGAVRPGPPPSPTTLDELLGIEPDGGGR